MTTEKQKRNQTFNRQEKKYRLDAEKFALMHDSVGEYMQVDSHNEEDFTYQICNIYFDTDENDLISKSIAKPKYKEKLRLRSYGASVDDESKGYLEIKKKVLGHGNKRRSAITIADAYKFVESGKLPELRPYMNAQVLLEIQYLLSRYKLKPKVYLAYERRAFYEVGNPDLRISFDTNILTRREDLRFDSGIYGKPLLKRNEWLMEIKTSKSLPVWLARLLSDYEIYPTGFSKYGEEYQRMLAAGMQYAEEEKYRQAS
jgi:SPX domain protein involved in polyphosphate accumulation